MQKSSGAPDRDLPDSTQLLSALPVPVVLLDAEERFRFANPAAELFLGISSAGLSQLHLTDLLPEDSRLPALVRHVRAADAPISDHDLTLRSPRLHRDGVAAHGAPMPEMPGAVILTLQDGSTAQKLDRQLNFRGAARGASAMAAMLAHEVKNPLSGIRGAAQLLEQSVPSEEVPLARLIREETDRIVNLIDRVEVFGDERPMEREAINIHVILDRVKLLARNGVARGIAFSEEYDPSLPPVLGNRDQLIQVFINLVKNASEALERTQKPEIRLTTAFRPGIRISVTGVSERISLPLEIVIEDNGPGVPPDILPFLFDPFVTTKTNGSGLGLALVAKIVGDHGGVIDCESRPGRTRFRILLPVASGVFQAPSEEVSAP